MLPLRISILALSLASLIAAQTPKETILLWPNGAPGAQGTADEDKPTLALYPASGSNKTSTAVIVCPGGGYAHLAMDHEGSQIAVWLNHLGISVCSQVPLRSQVSPPCRALGCAARHPVRAVASWPIQHSSRPHRHLGFFSGWPPGFYRSDSFFQL